MMDDKDIAIKINGIRKQYRLGAIGGTTLKESLQEWWANFRHRDNPNQRLGTDTRIIGKEFWALDNVSLTIHKGERVGIIGQNGAGKSTLLKILSRITAPTEGDIDIYGRISSMLELGAGFHREMTGRENIYMNGSILGMSQKEIDAKMDNIIKFSEIGEFIDTPIKRYSSGMLVKLAFAIASHLVAEILIMDEVLAVGDMTFQQKCLEKMRQTSEDEGRTILYVSHNMATIRRLCDRCIVLNKGKILYDGEVETAIAYYMANGMDKSSLEFDLTGKTRMSRKGNHGISLQHLSILDCDTPCFKKQDSLTLALSFTSEKPMNNLCVLSRFQTNDGIVLGSAYSNPINLTTSGEHKITVSMPLALLANGEYYTGIGLSHYDELGRPFILEYAAQIFKFEIKEPKFSWSTSQQGYIHFPELTVHKQ